MNYLELVQELARESGTTRNADPSGQGIDTLADPDNKHLEDLKAWIRKAWNEIQLQCDWSFNIRMGVVETTPGDRVIDLPTQVPDFRRLVPYFQPFTKRWIRLGERDPVFHVRYQNWAGHVARMKSQSRKPRNFTIRPDGFMEVWPEPPEQYEISFDYLAEPQILEEDEDIPVMPLRYHDLIVYRALVKYAGFDEASAQYQRAIPEIRRLELAMGRELLPEIRVRGAR